MKILILGGSGFVGTRLTELLLKSGQYQVVIGDIAPSKAYPELWRQCDVCSPEQLAQIVPGNDWIINLAAAHRDDVRPLSLYTQTNVEGARTVCAAAVKAGVKRIVFTSSVAIYGFPEYEYDETAPKKPFNEYGKTKLEAEAVYEEWQKSAADHQLHVIRPTVIFGEGNRGNIYNLFHELAVKHFMMIGDGQNKKSMAYIGNIVTFLKWNIEENQQAYSVYNYVDKPDCSMNELIELFEQVMGRKVHVSLRLPYWLGVLGGSGFDLLALILRKKLVISLIRIKKFCATTVFSSKKVQESGFVPPYSLKDGLTRTIQFEFLDGVSRCGDPLRHDDIDRQV